jgi:hypothetical protein
VRLTLNRAVKAVVTFHCETSLCFSTANSDLLPITGSVMGVHRRLSYETVGYAPDYITQE